jgi:hypothetical protein
MNSGMTGAVGSERLERSYRRLLACYPNEYRAMYGEEMIGVLMTASTPEQRRPDTREAFGLISTGLAARLRMTIRATHSPAWREAARAFGYLASVTMAALFGYQALAVAAHPFSGLGLSWVTSAVAIGWTLTAVAAGLGRRRLAAISSIAAAAGVFVAVTRNYAESPGAVVTSWWILMLAVTGATALVMLARPDGARRRPLGTRSRVALGLAAMLAVAAPALESLTVVVTRYDDNSWSEAYRPPFNWFGLALVDHRPVVSITVTVLVVLLAVVVLRLSPAVRRRVVLLALPAAATELVVLLTFNGFLQASARFDPPVYLVPPQWIILMVLPAVVFVAGAWLLARYEGKLASGALLG